jgi:uncharacterized protein
MTAHSRDRGGLSQTAAIAGTAGAQSPSVNPVRTEERIQTLDILRGFALLGMIVVHFHQRVHSQAVGVEDLIGWIIWVGIETKSWATFAFLFGVGFAILLRRVESKGRRFGWVYARRMLVLAAFGVVAEGFFGFQILLWYALWGMPLLVLRRLSTRTLFAVAVLAVAAHSIISAGTTMQVWPSLVSDADRVERRALAAAVASASEHGSFSELASTRFHLMAFSYTRPTVLVPDATLTLFILGLLAVRHGIVDDPKRHVRTIAGWMTFGFLSWATAWMVLYNLPDAGPLSRELHFGFGIVQDQWLCFTFIGSVALPLAYRPIWIHRVSRVGAAGRMALTNYLLQAAVLDWLASGYGLSLSLRPALGVPAAMGLFAVEMIASQQWLAHYRFGPLEWVWRSLTYCERQPIRRMERTPLATTS